MPTLTPTNLKKIVHMNADISESIKDREMVRFIFPS